MITMERATATTSLLASFATLKGLSDEKKYQSPYQILQEFIRHIIITESLHSFSADEVKNSLNKNFGFHVPEAVIKTATKKMEGVLLNHGIYDVSIAEIGSGTLFEEKKKEADNYSLRIIKDLAKYAGERMPNVTIDEQTLLKDLIFFLFLLSNKELLYLYKKTYV